MWDNLTEEQRTAMLELKNLPNTSGAQMVFETRATGLWRGTWWSMISRS